MEALSASHLGGTYFNLEIKSDTSVHFSWGGVGVGGHLPGCTPPPLLPLVSPSCICASVLLFCNFVRSCLKQHDSIFNWELLGGPPQGGWQEMKALCIVPDAFQPNTSRRWKRKSLFLCHTARVCLPF